MRGLIFKSVREVWVATLLFSAGLFAIEVLLSYLPPTFFKDYAHQWLQVPFFRNILTAILGIEIGGSIGPMAIASLAWIHPVVLALSWTHAIWFCTRVPAGEIDHGTADLLLSLPVSRSRIWVCESCVGFASSFLLMSCAVLGNLLGGWWAGPDLHPGLDRVLAAAANLWGLHGAVGGIAWAVSAGSDRRGRAAGVVLSVMIASFLLHFLAPFHEGVRKFSFMSLLHYHRPVQIIGSGDRPWRDLVLLVGVGSVGWFIGWVIFVRRDVHTV
jgi:hypothetical protein